jgi:hypothetical protein
VTILDMRIFLDDGVIAEAAFLDRVSRFDWESLRNKTVLVKGCGTAIIPPWAFMIVTARLTEVARRILYGNEHSSLPIYTRYKQETVNAQS